MKLNELVREDRKGKDRERSEKTNVIRRADFWPVGGSSKAIF